MQFSFTRTGAAREYIQDQLGSIQDLAIEHVFKIALLGRREFAVEQNQVGLVKAGNRTPESGAGLDCMMVSSTSAPAVAASDFNSSSDSSTP